MVEYCKSNERFATPAGNCDGERDHSKTQMHQLNWVPIEGSCYTFIKALHDTALRMDPPLSSAMVLDVFFATMVLTMVRPFFNASESSRVINWPEETKVTHLVYRPMLLVVKASKVSLDELCNHVRNIERYDQRCSGFLCRPHEAARLLPICSSNILVEEVGKFIDRIEVMWGLDGNGP